MVRDTSKYRLEDVSSGELLDIDIPWVYVLGVQFYKTGNIYGQVGAHVFHATAGGENSFIACYFGHDGLSTGTHNALVNGSGSPLMTVKDNCINGWTGTGIYFEYGARAGTQVYNNTVDGCAVGFDMANDTDVTAKNNIASGNTTDWTRVSGITASHNSSTDGTHPGSNGVTGTPSYVGSGDYHLAVGDTSWHTAGLGISSDSNVLTPDPDGDTRSGSTCSMGFDEYVSVGGGVTIPIIMNHLRNQGIA